MRVSSTAPRYRRFTAALCGLLAAAALTAQEQPAGIIGHYRAAGAALARKDFAGAVDLYARALAAVPSHPGLLAGMARAQHLAGNRPAAIEHLTRALRLGSGLDVVDDPRMAMLLAGDDAADVRQTAAVLRAPVATSTEAFRLREKDLIVEGIAYDPVERAFYVGSIYHRKIVRVDETGRATTFAGGGAGDERLYSVLGMKVDATRRLLWAATEGNLSMKDAAPAEDGRSALAAFDLRSGRLVRKFEPREPGRHLFNDIAIDSSGRAYVTDSEAGSVYVTVPAAGGLDLVAGPGRFEYPNGVALSADGRVLYVAHLAGISLIDVATRRVTPLAAPPDVALSDVDGLYVDDDGGRPQGAPHHPLIAVQNGLSPARIVRFDLAPGGDRVTGATVLERGNRLFASIPTTGALAGEWFYYIANSQVRAFTPDHRILPPDKLEETVVLKTHVSRPAAVAGTGHHPD